MYSIKRRCCKFVICFLTHGINEAMYIKKKPDKLRYLTDLYFHYSYHAFLNILHVVNMMLQNKHDVINSNTSSIFFLSFNIITNECVIFVKLTCINTYFILFVLHLIHILLIDDVLLILIP